MSIVPLKIKFCLCLMMFNVFANGATSYDKPYAVRLSSGAELKKFKNGLIETDVAHDKKVLVRLPNNFRKLLIPKYTGIEFPEDHSVVIEGKEYVLLVISELSNRTLRGYCGSGEEGTLYVLQIKKKAIAVPRYSLPVQSCLNDMELVSRSDDARYLSIKWVDNPIGFRVEWAYRRDSGPLVRTYRYNNGTFVEETEK